MQELTRRKAGGFRFVGLPWIISVITFFVGVFVTLAGYSGPYSFLQNHISDLGAAKCGNPSATSIGSAYLFNGYVCSPWHTAFNAAIALEGVLLILGVLFVRSSFPALWSSKVGFGLLLTAGFSLIGIGVFPEDTSFLPHSLFAGSLFLVGNLAPIVLGYSMLRAHHRSRQWKFSILTGSVGLISLLFFLAMIYGPLGTGGLEWLIVGPLLLWLIVTGIRVSLFENPDQSSLTARKPFPEMTSS